MGDTFKLRFVDRSGSPLAPRYHKAVQHLSRVLWRNYPFVLDEADRDNALEETLRRAAAHEERHGEVNNLLALIRRIFPQVASSMFLRKPYYARHEYNRTVSDLEALNTTQRGRASSEDRVYAQELLQSLTPRERHVVRLLVQGHKAHEIAGDLGLSVESVYQILHRVRKGLKRAL